MALIRRDCVPPHRADLDTAVYRERQCEVTCVKMDGQDTLAKTKKLSSNDTGYEKRLGKRPAWLGDLQGAQPALKLGLLASQTVAV